MVPASVGTIPLFHEGQRLPVSETFSQLPRLGKGGLKSSGLPCVRATCHVVWSQGHWPPAVTAVAVGGSKGRYLIVEGKDGLFYKDCFIPQCIICTGKDSIPGFVFWLHF